MTDNCSNCKNRADCKAVEALAEMHRRFGTPPKCNAYEPDETRREAEKEFVERVANAFVRAFGTGDTLETVEDAPAADVVKVVRCKDCKNAYINSFSAISGVALCRFWTNRAEGNQVVMQQDDFCSYGVRKEQTNG